MERCIDLLKPNDLFDSGDFVAGGTLSSKTKANIIETRVEEAQGGEEDSDDDDDDFVEVATNKGEDEEIELRYLGFLTDRSSEYTRDFNLELSVNALKVDEENKILVDIMKDLYKELKNSYLTKLQHWIKVNLMLILLILLSLLIKYLRILMRWGKARLI